MKVTWSAMEKEHGPSESSATVLGVCYPKLHRTNPYFYIGNLGFAVCGISPGFS